MSHCHFLGEAPDGNMSETVTLLVTITDDDISFAPHSAGTAGDHFVEVARTIYQNYKDFGFGTPTVETLKAEAEATGPYHTSDGARYRLELNPSAESSMASSVRSAHDWSLQDTAQAGLGALYDTYRPPPSSDDPLLTGVGGAAGGDCGGNGDQYESQDTTQHFESAWMTRKHGTDSLQLLLPPAPSPPRSGQDDGDDEYDMYDATPRAGSVTSGQDQEMTDDEALELALRLSLEDQEGDSGTDSANAKGKGKAN